MVFAHTAYADTEISHNPSTRATSLMYFAGTGVGFGEEGLELGAMSVASMQRGPDGRYAMVEQSDPTLRSAKMAEFAPRIRDHLAAWHEMFRDAMNLLNALPDGAFAIRDLRVARVDRHGES